MKSSLCWPAAPGPCDWSGVRYIPSVIPLKRTDLSSLSINQGVIGSLARGGPVETPHIQAITET